MLPEGAQAPAFVLSDQDGTPRALADYAGSWVLLYFYPKDDTPGCTQEACAIRENWSEFSRLGITVLGVSKDSAKSHRRFADKYKLPFTLLSDADTAVMRAYGVWAKKKFMGREYLGTVRASYLIGPDGRIARVYPAVKPAGHADEVLADLKVLKKEKAG